MNSSRSIINADDRCTRTITDTRLQDLRINRDLNHVFEGVDCFDEKTTTTNRCERILEK
jgi:hypothetical protein